MHRRSFLSLLAAEALPAGNPIRTGILRTNHGHVTGKLRVLRAMPEYEAVAVSEPDAKLRAARGREAAFSSLKWVSDQELLDDRSIQLVVVESDVPDAVGLGRKAIAAGKHLHIEKPPGTSMKAFAELIDEARRRRLLVQCGYVWRFHKGFDLVREAVRQGWLGDVYMLRGTMNTDLAASARVPLARFRGGMMLELGCHLIDRIAAVAGRPHSIKSWFRHDMTFDDRLADNTLAVLEYDKAIAVVSSSARMFGSGPHRSFEVIGTDGSMLIQPVEPGRTVRVNLRSARGPYAAGSQTVEVGEQPRYSGDLIDMARAIRSGEPLKYSYEHELLAHEMILRAAGEEV